MTDLRIGEASASGATDGGAADGRDAAVAGGGAAGLGGFLAPLFAAAEDAGLFGLRDAPEPDAPDPPDLRAALERAAADLPPGP